jgi:phospholipid/cholesterol/gamma-HCH transport system permease protein
LELVSFSWCRGVVLDVLCKQIYFTACQRLFTFIVLSLLYGGIILGILFHVIKTLGIEEYLGNIVVNVLVLEASPLIVVFLVSLRSSSAINAEIAVMKVNRELDALEAFRVNIECYLFAPRILCFMLSTALLSVLFSILVILGSFVFCDIIFQMNASTYTAVITRAIAYRDIVFLLFKSATFGFFISVIPLYHGWKTQYESTEIPISVLKGMTGVFGSIFIVEVLSLSVQFVLSSL